MKKLYSLLIALLLINSARAQQAYTELSYNEFDFALTSSGHLFHSAGDPMSTLKWSEDAINLIYASNLWIGGLTSDSQLHLSGELYESEQVQDFFPGVWSPNVSATDLNAINLNFDQIFIGNSADINTHIAYFNALQNGTVETEFPNGYVIPAWIQNWPVMINIQDQFVENLAPFHDYDQDNNYSPEAGDYPLFCGDHCAFVIFNDNSGIHNYAGGSPLGIEIRLMLFSYDNSSDPNLSNTIFAHYEIVNNSSQTIFDTYTGLWSDFDIGNSQDDYLMTNVQRSALVAYNGDSFDENSFNGPGFLDDLGAMGVMVLAGPPLDQDGTDNPLPDDIFSDETNSYGSSGFGFGDGIIDNERYGISHSLKIISGNNPIAGFPLLPTDYYNYLKGVWKNGQILTHGGNGIGQGEILNAKYYAPGATDPLHESTGSAEQIEWSDEQANNLPLDLQGLLSCGPFTLQPGEIVPIDFAFVFARDSQDGELNTLEIMDERLKAIKLFYNENACFQNETILSTNEISTELSRTISTFPNPASYKTVISSTEKINSIQLISITGEVIFSQTNINSNQYELDVTAFAAGLYLIKVDQQTIRLVIK